MHCAHSEHIYLKIRRKQPDLHMYLRDVTVNIRFYFKPFVIAPSLLRFCFFIVLYMCFFYCFMYVFFTWRTFIKFFGNQKLHSPASGYSPSNNRLHWRGRPGFQGEACCPPHPLSFGLECQWLVSLASLLRKRTWAALPFPSSRGNYIFFYKFVLSLRN